MSIFLLFSFLFAAGKLEVGERAHSFLWMNQCNRWHSRSQYWTALHLEHFLYALGSAQVTHGVSSLLNPHWPFIALRITFKAGGESSLRARLLTICKMYKIRIELRTCREWREQSTCWKRVPSRYGNSLMQSLSSRSKYSSPRGLFNIFLAKISTGSVCFSGDL